MSVPTTIRASTVQPRNYYVYYYYTVPRRIGKRTRLEIVCGRESKPDILAGHSDQNDT